MGYMAHGRWLESEMDRRDAADEEFSARIDERAELILDDLAKGRREADCEYIYEEPQDLLARIFAALYQRGVSGAERALDVEDVIRDEVKRVAKYLVEKEQ